MKAKSSYSGIFVSTAAKGTIGIISVIIIFVAGFIAWSAAGVGGAILEYIRQY